METKNTLIEDPPPTCGPQEELGLLTYAEVHKLTRLPLGSLYSMVARREIPHTRLGRRLVRFSRLPIIDWLRRHTVLPNEKT